MNSLKIATRILAGLCMVNTVNLLDKMSVPVLIAGILGTAYLVFCCFADAKGENNGSNESGERA